MRWRGSQKRDIMPPKLMDYSIFRAYDIRGIYPHQINEGVIWRIARHADKLLSPKKTVAIGYDARTTSPIFYYILGLGLERAGMRVIRAGLMTTPMLAFVVKKTKADAGIVVTASHNPPEYNGLKMINANGVAIGGTQILERIGKRSLSSNIDIDNILSVSSRAREKDFSSEYVDMLASYADIKRPLRVVCDASNGVTGPILLKLSEHLSKMGVDCILLNIEADGSFSVHGPDPSYQEAWKQMSEMVQKEKADFGIVFDGDGDRALICDEKGGLMRPEYIWRFLLTIRKGNTHIHDVTSSYLTHKLAAQLEGRHGRSVSLVDSKVGHLYITNAMKKQKADLGFEYSGHFYFKEIGGVSSGLMTLIQILNASSVLPYTMSTFTSLLPSSVRANEVDVTLSSNQVRALISVLKKQYRSDKVDTIDGISVNRETEWFSIRPSNTSDVVRINIEGETIKEVNILKKEILKVVKNIKH